MNYFTGNFAVVFLKRLQFSQFSGGNTMQCQYADTKNGTGNSYKQIHFVFTSPDMLPVGNK